MKRILLTVCCGVALVATGAFAQGSSSDAAAIDTALLPAPANLREGATVIKWKSDFSYDTLRKGTNRLVCYDRTGLPEQQPFSVECTSIGNLDRVAQNVKAEAGGDKAKTQAILDAMEKDGTRAKPEYGSVWYHMIGVDREHAHLHITIALPGATTQSTGIPDKRRDDGVWLMNPGTSTAHIMTPGA